MSARCQRNWLTDMLTAEIKINGVLIGHIYIVNEYTNADGDASYRWEYYEPDGGLTKGAGLTHKRSDGAVALIAKVAKLVGKRKPV